MADDETTPTPYPGRSNKNLDKEKKTTYYKIIVITYVRIPVEIKLMQISSKDGKPKVQLDENYYYEHLSNNIMSAIFTAHTALIHKGLKYTRKTHERLVNENI